MRWVICPISPFWIHVCRYGIAGSLLAGPLQKRFGFGRVIIVTPWIWALTWLFYAIAPNPLLLGLVNGVSFVFVPIYMVVQYSYRLAAIPDHLQGRVNSVFRLIAFGGQPLGIALTGILLQALGPVWTVLLTFIPQGILVVVVTFNRHVRAARSVENGCVVLAVGHAGRVLHRQHNTKNNSRAAGAAS